MKASTIDVAGLDGGLVRLTSEQLDELDSRVEGPLLRAGDAGWDDAVLIWNGMVAKAPALVLQPTSAVDVAAAVGFARDHGLLLSIKGGGHNMAGTSIAERGLTLDMSRMRDVTVDPDARLAHVGPGCLLRDVDRATQAHGLATPLGSFSSEVGVAGLTLGGGLGYLTRRFGWTVDNLEEVEIVTADGQIRTASRDENADLFWALRGGGGNFGVVTRFTFRLHEVGPTDYRRPHRLECRPGRRRARDLPRPHRVGAARVDRGRDRAPRAAGPVPPRGVARQAHRRAARVPQRRRRGGRPRPGSRPRRPDRRPRHREALHRPAVDARRHGAQGAPLLLEDRVPGRAVE